MSILVGSLIIVALVLATAFFVAVEFSLIAADRQRLDAAAAGGSVTARSAVRALRKLSFHLSGAQLGITLVSLVIGFVAEPVIGAGLLQPVLGDLIEPGSTASVVISLLLATTFQMVVGELIPKNIAITHPDVTARTLAPAALVVDAVFSPVIFLFNGAANWFLRRVGVEPKEEMDAHRSLDEISYLIHSSGDSGALDPESHSLLTRTLRFGRKTVADALTPRVHVAAVESTATVADLAAEIARTRHSRYPVINGDLDHIRGIVTLASVFDTPVGMRADVPVTTVMHQPLVVPETRDLADLLDDFRAASVQMAVVIDEHGGTAGILTLEDVLEELVGDVDDEHDDTQTLTAGVGEGVVVVAGTLHIDEVDDLVDLTIPHGDYETIAGFVLAEMGRIPTVGDAIVFRGWTIEVAEMDGLRIASLQLEAPDR
ncbi:MAG: hemolysin family protein [Actinomycetota bacterium]